MFLCLLDILEGFSFRGIPCSWLMSSGFIALFCILLVTGKITKMHSLWFLLLLLFYSCFITWFNNMQNLEYRYMFPENVTTEYTVYIMLRNLAILGMISETAVIYTFLQQDKKEGAVFEKYLCGLGGIVAISAIYIYVAFFLGLPVIQGTRLSTGATEQEVFHEFSSSFHRAYGTFLEPSHLARWLILPLLLSLKRWKTSWRTTCLMAVVLLLTGSLLGFLSLAGAFLLAFICFNKKSEIIKKFFLRCGTSFIIILVLLFLFVIYLIFSENGITLITTFFSEMFWDRIDQIFTGGMKVSNRGMIYEFIEIHPFPIFGYGLGNQQIIFSEFENATTLVSFLSLYFNFLYGTGYVGFLLLASFLLIPLVLFFKYRNYLEIEDFFYLIAYLAYLIIFAVGPEEFILPFAITYALFYNVLQIRSQKRSLYNIQTC